jgi:hypothetical protein
MSFSSYHAVSLVTTTTMAVSVAGRVSELHEDGKTDLLIQIVHFYQAYSSDNVFAAHIPV